MKQTVKFYSLSKTYKITYYLRIIYVLEFIDLIYGESRVDVTIRTNERTDRNLHAYLALANTGTTIIRVINLRKVSFQV